jgi:diguanylate cyclase (GGDEF)-like protein
LISLKKSVSELERWEILQESTMESYRGAIESLRQYAVEIDAVTTEEHRRHLAAIAADLGRAATPEHILETRSWLRGELRDYCEKAAKYLGGLRDDLETSAQALERLVDSIVRNGSDQQQRLGRGLKELRQLVGSDDLDKLRTALAATIGLIEESVEQLQMQNQLVVAQLQDEISTLHKTVERTRKAAATDPVTGVSNRQGIEAGIEREINSGKTFCLLSVWIRNLKQVQHHYGRHLGDEAVAACCRRLMEAVGRQVTLGRLADDEFVVVIPLPKSDTMKLAQQLSLQLSGTYALMKDGQLHHLSLEISTIVVDHQPGQNTGALLEKANHLIRSFEEVMGW